MSQSGPEGRALIEAGRKAFRPSSDDRERVLQALRARIQGGGDLGGAASPAAPAAKGLGWLGASAAATVGLAIVTAVLLRQPEGEVQHAPATGAPSSVVPASPTPPVEAAPEVAPVAAASLPVASAPAVERSPAARRASDRLKEEVAILSRAESERHAGRFATALTLLEEHRRKFPRGGLAQERMAARIRVLCSLGRVSEAERELATLRRASPTSVHLPARAACTAK